MKLTVLNIAVMDELRYNLMDNVRAKTALGYSDFLSLFIDNYGRDPLCKKEDLFSVFKKRSDSISVRASLVHIIYNFLREYSLKHKIPFQEILEEDLTKLSTSCEGGMSNMYLDNQIYDAKAGVNARPIINNTLATSNMQKECLYDYLGMLSANHKDVVIPKFKKSFIDVDRGQRLDAFINFNELNSPEKCSVDYNSFKENELLLVKSIIEDLANEFPDYADLIWVYFERIYLLNSTFLKNIVQIILELTKFPEDNKISAKLKAFAEIYGMILQLVNDVNDFVYDQPTDTKIKTDVLSDLKNHTISLPIILHFISDEKGLVNKYIKQAVILEHKKSCSEMRKLQQLLENKHNHVLKEVIESGALIKTQEIAKKLVGVAEVLLSGIEGIEMKKTILDLLKIAKWNRYYYHLKKARQAYQKGEFYLCEDNISGRKVNQMKFQTN